MVHITLPAQMSVEVSEKTDTGSNPRRLQSSAPPTVGKHGLTNLYSMFSRSVDSVPDNKCFGTGSFSDSEWITYGQAHALMLKTASGVAGLGLGKCNFGMYMVNCLEFQIIAIGCFSQGMTCVPIYDTLGDNIVEYEVNHAELPIMFLEEKKVGAVAKVVGKCPSLKHVVQVQPNAGSPPEAFVTAGIAMTDLPSLQAAGEKSPVSPNPAGPEDLAYIMYTSGTTGDPKGVCIKQIAITVGASYCGGIELLPTDRYLSFLPLAHIFETMVEHAILSVGGAVGFYGGNIKALQTDIVALKPTLFVGVPRVYQRFYEKAEATIDSKGACIKALLKSLLASETANVRAGNRTWKGKLLGKLLGKKVHGGQVRLMISGAAPLPLHVQEFLLASMGCQVVQGYGMTENCANGTLMNLDDYRAGHVGAPFPTVDIKLLDVPEMDYTASLNSSGEVCTRGVVNFSGYHKNQKATDEVLDADGWLHTGDIGRWNPDGTLSIIDRRKNLFKLAQGEYIAPEKIEMFVSKSKYIAQPWVYGNSFLPMLVAVVTPDWANLEQAAKDGGWFTPGDTYESLAAKKQSCDFILAEMVREGKAAKLKPFELPKAVVLEGKINELLQGFSIDNDCLTPTFKLKRPQLLKRYKTQVDEMYVALGEDPTKQQ